jgi:hypothetical protein
MPDFFRRRMSISDQPDRQYSGTTREGPDVWGDDREKVVAKQAEDRRE